MKWSYRIATVASIDIKVHLSFVLILVLGAIEWGGPHGAAGALFGVSLMLALFACVTLHELGHSLAAQHYGLPVREIILLPIGGLAMLGKLPKRPFQELVIAAAGPLVNVVIAVLLVAATGLVPGFPGLDGQGLVSGTIPPPSLATAMTWLLFANVTLVVFNLIPAFPLDGGRILRALLAMVTNWANATRIASAIGQLAAVGLGLLGVFSGNFLLAIIAVFIFLAAGAESSHAQSETVLTTLEVGHAYNRHALTLSPGHQVSTVVDFILTSYQPDFAVTLGDRLLGVVSRDDVLRTLAARDDDPYVAEIMRRDVVRVDVHDSLESVREALAEASQRVAAVFSSDRYLGLVSTEDIGEAFTVLTFLNKQRDRASTAAAA